MSQLNGPGRNRRFVPTDLIVTALFGIWMFVPTTLGFWSPARMAVGLLAVFLIPGYALVSALFPIQGPTDKSEDSTWFGTDWIQRVEADAPTLTERVVLSAGLSVCIVPLLGLGLELTPWMITRESLLSAIGAVTVLCTVLAALRRWQVPAQNRFSLSASVGMLRGIKWAGDGAGNSLLNRHVVLAVSLVVAGTGLGMAVQHPTVDQGERFTEFSLQTEDPATGELVAGGYPTNESIERRPLYLGITNHEGEKTTYTVFAKLQRFHRSNGQRVMVSELTVNRTTVSAAPGETVRFRHDFDRESNEYDTRLIYLLYTEEPPANLTAGNAYRTVHIWVG